MTIKEMLRIKEERGYSYQFLAEKSGVEAATIQKIMTGKTKRPRRATLAAIQAALVSSTDGYYAQYSRPGMLREEVAAYETAHQKQQDSFTIDDLADLPENARIELINGILITADSPDLRHLYIVQRISETISGNPDFQGKEYLSFHTRVGVHLFPDDDSTLLFPDIAVICDPDLLRNSKWVEGAPEFVLDVLSPSTRKYDMTVKPLKYLEAGVKTLWLIDPDHPILIIYDSTDPCTPTISDLNRVIRATIRGIPIDIDFPSIRKDWDDRFGKDLSSKRIGIAKGKFSLHIDFDIDNKEIEETLTGGIL